jgi:DNA-binding response OmpR family regulator
MPKVMVVDDEESLLEAIRYALSREGIEVVTARDGGEAMGRVPPDPGHQPGSDPHAHRP